LIHFHAGVEGNELADILAKEAAEDDGDLRIVCNRKPTTKERRAHKVAETMG